MSSNLLLQKLARIHLDALKQPLISILYCQFWSRLFNFLLWGWNYPYRCWFNSFLWQFFKWHRQVSKYRTSNSVISFILWEKFIVNFRNISFLIFSKSWLSRWKPTLPSICESLWWSVMSRHPFQSMVHWSGGSLWL